MICHAEWQVRQLKWFQKPLSLIVLGVSFPLQSYLCLAMSLFQAMNSTLKWFCFLLMGNERQNDIKLSLFPCCLSTINCCSCCAAFSLYSFFEASTKACQEKRQNADRQTNIFRQVQTDQGDNRTRKPTIQEINKFKKIVQRGGSDIRHFFNAGRNNQPFKTRKIRAF